MQLRDVHNTVCQAHVNTESLNAQLANSDQKLQLSEHQKTALSEQLSELQKSLDQKLLTGDEQTAALNQQLSELQQRLKDVSKNAELTDQLRKQEVALELSIFPHICLSVAFLFVSS